ncbi:MAG: DNA gyrase inhibitor YacG [Alphaproteobacteria bacterium]|nr:DNA gyrase inhibitor YacG [Alphaproteobacteria bacterium]
MNAPPSRPSPPLRAVRTAPTCPVCGRPTAPTYRPFCTKRCADIDLGRWLKESYRVPSEEPPDGEGGAPDPAPGGPSRGPTGQDR